MESLESEHSAEEWYGPLDRPTKTLPPIVYYYCSVDAFVQIVTKKTLWLTNVFFTNDREEHFWLRSKARRFVENKLRRHADDDGYQWLETILRQEWRQEIYCACFSEQPDLLSQWRAYADDGRGFAIGFNTAHLQWLSDKLRGSLSNVIYDDDQQAALIERAFDLPPRACDGEDPTIEEGAGTILGRLNEAASRCKSRAFSEEAEWRLVCEPIFVYRPEDENTWTKASVPRYMERRGLVTPYVEIPLVEGLAYDKRGAEPIKEVYFGPRNLSVDQEYAVKQMLERGRFKRVRIVKSSISYR